MTAKMLIVVRKVNVIAMLCQHLMGDSHHVGHRMAVGFVVMVCGVLIAKQAHHFHYTVIEVGFDLVGYGVHGLGLTPYVEHLLEKFSTKPTVEEEA